VFFYQEPAGYVEFIVLSHFEEVCRTRLSRLGERRVKHENIIAPSHGLSLLYIIRFQLAIYTRTIFVKWAAKLTAVG
jgi:hypothetical protein